jgi:hypothetical protein
MIANSVLATLSEGDVFETPPLFPGLCNEPMAWKVLEHAEICGDPPRLYRVTIHGYYHDIYVCAAGVTFIEGATEATWNFS